MIEPICIDIKAGSPISLPARRHLVLCPAIDEEVAFRALRLMSVRAGVQDVAFVALKDLDRLGFIKTLNQAFRSSDSEFVSYVAQDAFAGVNWLAMMELQFERSTVNFSAYNCGKWNGRIAAFGCARSSWLRPIYAGDFFYPGYISHRADNEITIIARGNNCFSFNPACVLVEVDYDKPFRAKEDLASNFHLRDREIFEKRFKEGFDGLISAEAVSTLIPEYIKRKASLIDRGREFFRSSFASNR